MKAKYIGHPDDRKADEVPRRVGFAGKSFPRGHFVSVDDIADKKALAKLQGNPSFEVSEEPLTDAEEAAAAEAGSMSPAPGTPEAEKTAVGDLDKAQVLERLNALKAKGADVEFSAKWGLPKLKEALENAEFEAGEDE